MMKLRAVVRNVTGKTVHLRGERVVDGIGASTLPAPTSVEVVEQDGAFYLLRLDDDGKCIADTWHETVAAAKAQANFEYGIREEDWRSPDNRH
jgi:hypothetical protein